MIHVRLTLEQRTYIHEDVQDLIYFFCYFVALHWADVTPFGNLLGRLFWIHIKTQHELAQFIEALAAMGFRTFCLSSRSRGRTEYHSIGCHVAIVTRGGIDLQKRRSCIHLYIRYGHYLPDSSENGATTSISIFMASSTANRSPIATVSPGFTRMETSTAGAGACTTPPSPRSIRCETPSTSI